MEESADECLTGMSVVDPIAPELPPLPASPVLSANIEAGSVSVPVISDNTASTALPASPPSTILLGPETQSVSASPTTNDTSPGEVAHLSSENEAPDSPLANETPSGSSPSTSQLPSPEISSQDLFSVLVADATVRSGSSDPDTVSPAVDTRSALLADPRCLELMLRELPLFMIFIPMLNLLSMNINGLNDHLKRTALVDWLKCLKADVVCLQETHAPSHESIQKWFANSGYRVVSSCCSNKSGGTAILVNDTYKVIS